MSVIANHDVWLFRAPLSLGNDHISTVGSWESIDIISARELRVSPLYKGHFRVSTWKQQLTSCIAECCVDWTYYNHKCYIYLQFIAPKEIGMVDIDLISDKVVSMIQNNVFLFKLQTVVQQEHPGLGCDSGTVGNDGKEGDSHSV